MGFVGSLIGICLGQLVAYFSVLAVEKTISTMYSTISISDYMTTKNDAFAAFLLGIAVSIIASLIPSYEASKIRPNETSRVGSFEGKYKEYYKIFSVAGLCFTLLGVIFSFTDYTYTPFNFPILTYIGILLIITGFTFFSPFYLYVVLKNTQKPIKKIFRIVGNITIGDMRGNNYRFSVALMSVAISSALIIALLTLIFSLKASLEKWINQYIVADVYIKPASCKSKLLLLSHFRRNC